MRAERREEEIMDELDAEKEFEDNGLYVQLMNLAVENGMISEMRMGSLVVNRGFKRILLFLRQIWFLNTMVKFRK
jgi:hypothetical protein